MTDALTHLADLLATTPRSDAEAWLLAGLARWVKHGGALGLSRCLDLPATPIALRRIQRDRLLRKAAQQCNGTTWTKAGELRKAVLSFHTVHWPTWKRLDTTPPTATELQRILFDCCKTGAAIPDTRRRLHSILLDCEANSAGNFTNTGIR